MFVAPLDGSYATTSGLRVGAKESELAAVTIPFSKKDRNGTISYCFRDGTLVTVAGTGSATPADVCAPGTICDLAIGGCKP